MPEGTAVRGLASVRWTPQGSQTEQAIDIDCSVREVYTSSAEPTEKAVEEGANISDHVKVKNRTITLECLISGTPIDLPTFGMDGASASVQALAIDVGGSRINANVWTFSQPFDRVAACDVQFQALVEAGQRLTVFTGVRRVSDCVLTEYTWNRSAENGNDLDLKLEFSRLRIATTRRVGVTAPRQRRGRTQSNRGAQPTTEATPTQSAAFRLIFG